MLKKPVLILIILTVVFGGVYFWLVTPIKTDLPVSSLDQRFDWPDEVANYFWSKHYAQTGQLNLAEPLNDAAENQIHPRSFNVRGDGALVPGSFLGLILLYGTLAKIFSVQSIIYFTPILALLGVLAFYGIIKRIFNQKIALVSAILMLFHPAWWYYSVTSMLPNVAFVSLILLSIYFLIRARKISLPVLLLAGFLAGLAISIRPSELIWLGIVYLAVIIYLGQRLKITKLILFLAIAAIVILPSLYQQQLLYGDYLISGYNQLQENSPAVCQSCGLVKALIMPFGFHPTLIVANFWTHYISRLWWLSLLFILGLVSFFVQPPKKQTPQVFGYVLVSLLVFFWLGAYYGSWQFTDLLTVHLNTLGLSYVRYWLPLYILALPFVAIGLIWLSKFLKNRWQIFALTFFLAVLFYVSADLVLQKKPDSILPVKNRIVSYKQNAFQINQLTEAEAVIVTVRKDKLFFPERKVIHTFQALSLNQELQTVVAKLVKLTPVYYYALGPEPVLAFDNGLSLQLIGAIGQELLYKIQ